MADPIDLITANPDLNNPAEFEQQANLAWTQLKASIPQMNTAINALNINSVQDVSTSSITIGTGIHTFTVSAGKSWLPGMNLVIASTEDPGFVWLSAIVISYGGTSLTVNVLQFMGTAGASIAGWTITLSAPPQIDYENYKLVVKSSPGMGSTNTKIRRFTTVEVNTLTNDITYADTVADGASFTATRESWYLIRYREKRAAGIPVAGITINSNQLTTNFGTGITIAHRLAELTVSVLTNTIAECRVLVFLTVGDTLRAHISAVETVADDDTRLEISRVSLKGMGGGGGGGGGGAPTDADYIVGTTNGTLTNERVATTTASITVDVGTTGQAQFKRSAITGDVSIPADNNVATIPTNTVTNTKLANMPSNTVKVNNSNLDADPVDLLIPASSVLGRDATGNIVPLTMGTNMSIVAGALTSAGGGGGGGAPTTAQYIVAASDATLTAERVATSGTSITVDIGTAGQAIFKRAALTGDVTSPADSNAMTIPNNTITNAKQADMAANTIKMNATAATADPADFAVVASRLIGRADTGNITAIPLSANFSWTAGTLGLAGVALWDGTNFKNTAGDTILFNNGVYTWAAKPAANTVPSGTHILIDTASFGGTHKYTIGPTAVSDGSRWLPAGGRQLLARGSGSVAAPLATASGTAATVFNIAAPFSMPASFFEYTGGGVYVKAKFRKTGADANASVFSVKLGKFTTAANDAIASVTTTAAAGRDVVIEENARVIALGVGNTASFVSGLVPSNIGSTPAIIADKSSTGFDTTVVMYVTLTAHCALNAAATHELLEYEIWWIA